MLIKIDCREIKLISLITELLKTEEKIKMVSENLPLGDIILCDDEGQEKALHNHQIYYLIEGDLRYYRPFKGLPDKKALLSAMTSISYFKGFSLNRTLNLEETAEWLVHFAHKLEKEGSQALPFYASDKTTTNTSYAEVINKRVKKDNITPENIGEIMLAQIPHVSSASAAAIMKKFGTFSALIAALQTDPNSLIDITSANKNGQLKKLTKPCTNAIYDFLVKQTIINVEI
jgi:ERCC4-type nuclease